MIHFRFEPTKWFRVIGPDRKIWCETSSESEAREAMRPDDSLERLYEKVERKWVKVET